MPTTSPNMNLIVPSPSSGATGSGDPGPGYAQNISSDLLTLVDAHDHSTGKGVQITPAGLNISSDLSVNSNNLTTARSVRFTSQASGLVGVGDVAEVYVKSGDLWYVNSSGTQVQVTSGSSLATGVQGGPGPQGVAGSFSGTVNQPTGLWQPTGQFSGSYDVVSWLAKSQLGTGGYTGVAASYVIQPNKGTVVSVLANIVGYDSGQGFLDVDVKGTFYGASGGTVTGVGTFTYCYQAVNPVGTGWPVAIVGGSGWGVALVPTGSQISLMLSVPTGGPSGAYIQFASMLQITERGNP